MISEYIFILLMVKKKRRMNIPNIGVSDVFTAAVSDVEKYRYENKIGPYYTLTPDQVNFIGPVNYIKNIWNDDLRRKAHEESLRQWLDRKEWVVHSIPFADKPNSDVISGMKFLWLDWFGVRQYLKELDSHIHYIRAIGSALFPKNKALNHRLLMHDASKYLHEEVFGYVLRWTHGDEGPEWNASLKHHYTHNDHHPQFFKDGGPIQPEEALIESIIDMLSWNFIKNQSKHIRDTTHEWVYDIQEQYLDRYTAEDKKKVILTLKEWKKKNVPFPTK